MTYGRAKQMKDRKHNTISSLNKTFDHTRKAKAHNNSLVKGIGSEIDIPVAGVLPNTSGPARGNETGIKGLLGGASKHVETKSYSVERIPTTLPASFRMDLGVKGQVSPYLPDFSGKARYREAMSSATGRRVGIANAIGVVPKKTPYGLKRIGGKKKFVSVWDALQIEDSEAYKSEVEEQKKRAA